MKTGTLIFLFVCSTLAMLSALYFSFKYPATGRYYDCGIAEISPDFPPAVREQCRKLNAKIVQAK